MGADLPPPSRICVYACVYAYTHTDFLCLFLILSVERGYNRFDPKKITIFSGTTKVGPICPTFIRVDPYESHKPPKKDKITTLETPPGGQNFANNRWDIWSQISYLKMAGDQILKKTPCHL